jgi:hypothetical protein
MAIVVEPAAYHRFGLGHILLPVEQEVRILTALGWDGESLPYPLLVQFFEDAVQDALTRIEESVEPCPVVKEAFETGSYIPRGVPEEPMPS